MTGTISAAIRSGKGCVRSGNEDCWYLNGTYPASVERMDEEAARAAECPADGALFAVCDGVGGAARGEVASWTAVSRMQVLQESLRTEDIGDTVRQWVSVTNQAVLDATQGGGSTLAMVYVRDGQALMGHIGDSRVYLLRDGTLQRLTKDHSKVQMLMDTGLITQEEATVHPHRHVILRSLGMNEDDGPCVCDLSDPLALAEGDRLMICSDGVTDMLPDDVLTGLLAMEGTADECAEAIYKAALEAGGADNTTVMVLDYHEADAVQPPAKAAPKRGRSIGRVVGCIAAGFVLGVGVMFAISDLGWLHHICPTPVQATPTATPYMMPQSTPTPL